MRQNRKPRSAMQSRVCLAIDRLDDRLYAAIPEFQPFKHGALAHLAVGLQPAHEGFRRGHRTTVARQQDAILTFQQPVE